MILNIFYSCFYWFFLFFFSNQVKKFIFKWIGKKNHENCCFIEIMQYFVSSLPSYPILPQMVGLSQYMKDLFTQFERNWSLHIGCNIYYSVTHSFLYASSAWLSHSGFATDFYLVKISRNAIAMPAIKNCWQYVVHYLLD